MKRFPPISIVIALTVMLFAAAVFGQDPQNQPASNPERPVDRMNIIRDLGLSQDQVRQMRLINQDIRTKRQAARLRMTEATKNLDQAIYADIVDEAMVAQRLNDLQNAQAEIAKINFENEFAIRKILTPEQLVRFREIRRRFNEARENLQRQRQNRIQKHMQQRPGVEQQPMTPANRQPVNNASPTQRTRPL